MCVFTQRWYLPSPATGTTVLTTASTGSNCIPAEEEGVLMLHGNRGVFHSDKQPAFKAVYDAFKHVSYITEVVFCFFPPIHSKANKSLFTLSGSTYLDRIS